MPIRGICTSTTSPFTRDPEALGIIGDRWTPFSNESVAGLTDTITEMSGAQLKTALVLNGGRKTGLSALELAVEMEARGAGEIVLNSIDRDGTMRGYDLALARQLRAAVNVPISMVGGASSLEDIEKLVREVGVLGAVAGSLFVFKGRYRAVLINYPQADMKEKLILRSLKN